MGELPCQRTLRSASIGGWQSTSAVGLGGVKRAELAAFRVDGCVAPRSWACGVGSGSPATGLIRVTGLRVVRAARSCRAPGRGRAGGGRGPRAVDCVGYRVPMFRLPWPYVVRGGFAVGPRGADASSSSAGRRPRRSPRSRWVPYSRVRWVSLRRGVTFRVGNGRYVWELGPGSHASGAIRDSESSQRSRVPGRRF